MAAGSDGSKRLGAQVQQCLIGVTGYRDRGLKSAEFGVLNTTNHAPETAGCLAEISFLTQAADEMRLQQSEYVTHLGATLATAVDDFVRRKTRGPAPEVSPGVPDDLENH